MTAPLVPLDIERPADLLAYLRVTERIAPDEEPAIRVLAGGVSNRTVLVERPGGEAWVLKQALAKLRVTVDWYSPPERIHREALGLRWLRRLAPPGTTVPFLFEDHTHHLLAMAAVPWPHDNWKSLLLAGRVEPHHVARFGHLLGTIHHRARAAGPAVADAFADSSYFESLRLEPYSGFTATQIPAAAAFLTDLISQTRAHRVTLVHGDYSPKNVLIAGDGLVLLDHEVAHWGDPAFDLGFGLTHLLSKAHHLPTHRAAFATAALTFWENYAAAAPDLLADGLEGRAVRSTLGCLLARVAGRSPLEYLDAAERARQRAAVLALIPDPPPTVAALAARFVAALDDAAGGLPV